MPDNHIQAGVSAPVAALLEQLKDFLSSHNIEAYAVGGIVRDLAMKRTAIDVDIAVAGDALAVGRQIAESLCAHCVVLDTENGVVRLLPIKDGEQAGTWQLDIASLQGSLTDDLKRRDFTINAMAIDLAELRLERGKVKAGVIDPLGGLRDVGNKLIRAVIRDIFKNDPIRLLRGVRLGAELGFEIEPDTHILIERDAPLVTSAAGERVREELLKLFTLPRTYDTVVHMQKLGLLFAIFPEMAATHDVDQPREHTWNVFLHSVRSIDALDFILRKGEWEFTGREVLSDIPMDDDIQEYFAAAVSPPSTRRSLTKLAALLHDVAKPQTRVVNEFGKVRFYGHPQEGAPIAASILERLRFSSKEVKFIETIVRYHLRPVQMTEDGAPPTPRAIYRYFRDMGDAGVATLYFSLADHLATRGPDLEQDNWDWHVGVVAQLVEEYRRKPPAAAPKRLLDGNDLKSEFDIAPGKKMGELLEELDEAQGAGEIATREEALAYVRKLLAQKEKPESGIKKARRHPASGR